MRTKALLLLFTLPSCLQIGTGTGTGSGAGYDAGSAALATASATDAGPSGTNCFEDPGSQTVLCEQISLCPGLVVEPGAYPDCGFRMGVGVELDLECLCGTALCPIGVPTTCGQAKLLLDAQSVLIVCEQEAEGRCVDFVTPDAGLGGTCDKACAAECAGAPSCFQLCGC